jgi:anti-sigma B factor antagonist
MPFADFRPKHITIDQRGDVCVVGLTVARFTDEDNIEALGRELFALVDQFGCRKIVVSMFNVDLVSSAVLGKLISLHRRLHRASGALVLCDLKDNVANTVRASRLATYFHVEPNLEAALTTVG